MTHCNLFDPSDDQDQLLAAHLPEGGVFDAARTSGTVFNDLLIGLATELFRVESQIRLVCGELDPTVTVDLLPEWEKSVTIPDDCFTNIVDLQTRRDQVLVKLKGLRIQTAADYTALGAIFGVAVEVEAAAVRGVFPMKFPILFFATPKVARFTMIVHFPGLGRNVFPILFPIPFTDNIGSIMECLITNLAPANVDVIFSFGTNIP